MAKKEDLQIREINGIIRGLNDLEAGRVTPFEQIERELQAEYCQTVTSVASTCNCYGEDIKHTH